MQFHNNAKVQTAGGDTVGRVDRVVMDPRTQEVTHLVVRKGTIFTEDKVLPRQFIASTTEDTVTLSAEAGDLAQLPKFEDQHYVMLDGNGGEPVRAAERQAAVADAAVPALLWYPPALGGFTGPAPVLASPYAATAMEPRYVTQVDRNIPENTVALKEGAKVVAADGEHVGDVERVILGRDNSHVTHLLISQGVLFKSHKPIPVAWIGEVMDKEVHLAVGADVLKRLPEYEE
jgi:uncharacterized protein YrrD